MIRLYLFINGRRSTYDAPVPTYQDAVEIAKNIYGDDVQVVGFDPMGEQPERNKAGLWGWF